MVDPHEPLEFRVGKLGQRGRDGVDQRFVDLDRQQIGIREVAVVVRFLLGAHGARLVSVGIVEARLLPDCAAAFQHLNVARGLDLDRFLDEAERVQVFELRARAELRFAERPHRDVGVATERPLLHVAVGDLEVATSAWILRM